MTKLGVIMLDADSLRELLDEYIPVWGRVNVYHAYVEALRDRQITLGGKRITLV